MFVDQFLPNALLAAVGFATALTWLRTGMVRRGVLLLAWMAVGLDITLVARFVYGDRGAWFEAGLWSMQLAALAAGLDLAIALVRRRWSADARRRDELFAAAFQHYLRSEFGPARDLFRRILRADPWNVAATVALANVQWRLGRRGRARSLFLRARQLDRRRTHADFVAEQLRRLAANGTRSPDGRAPIGGRERVGAAGS